MAELLDAKTAARQAKKAKKVELQATLAALKKAQKEQMEKKSEEFKDAVRTTAAKYKTVNGYMQARETLRDAAMLTNDLEAAERMAIEEQAVRLANEVNQILLDILERFDATPIEEYPTYFDCYIEYNFIDTVPSAYKIAQQLMVFQAAQQFDDGLDGIQRVWYQSEHDIEEATKKLEELK